MNSTNHQRNRTDGPSRPVEAGGTTPPAFVAAAVAAINTDPDFAAAMAGALSIGHGASAVSDTRETFENVRFDGGTY